MLTEMLHATRVAPLMPAGGPRLSGHERLLWEAAERAWRHKRDRVAVVLHLSRLRPPAPRPHHLRVARVLLQDSASRFGGQVFAMHNQDLVLLCTRAANAFSGSADRAGAITAIAVTGQPAPDVPARDRATAPEALPGIMARLFSADVADPAELVSVWLLDDAGPALQAYLAERADAALPPPAGQMEPSGDQQDGVGVVTTLHNALETTPLGDLIVQQTGMSLSAEPGRSLADRLAPAFRKLSVSFDSFQAGWPVRGGLSRRAPLQAVSSQAALVDPFLFRHVAAGLDMRLIQLLSDDFSTGGCLTRPSIDSGLPIHLDLGLEAILSPAFARLSRQAHSRGVRLGAGITLMQACADLDLMEHARGVLNLTGGDLILNDVEPDALAMVCPAALQPDLIKLQWSPVPQPRQATGWATSILADLPGDIDPRRVILQRVDGPAALAWGHAHGIRLFEGPFLEQVQAATRMSRCHSARLCTVRQCLGRAGATTPKGRAGCANPALLGSFLATAQ